MQTSPLEKHFLHPGEYYATGKPAELSTLLGSCVAVCLYDPYKRIIGMNHFLLAGYNLQKNGLLDSDAGRYGMGAMELLINAMLKQGAQRKHLKAKAFGGGSVLGTRMQGDMPERFQIGKVNVNFVTRYLKEDGIPLVAHHLGGDIGRQIRFESADFSVYMRRIPMRNMQRLVSEEKQYFDKTLQQQTEDRTAEFW
jgi:chemotaxis protein CheD